MCSRLPRLLILCALSPALFAQTTKRPLTAADYDRWETVRAEKLANNGRYVAYQIDPQEGDGRLEIVPTKADYGKRYVVPRGYGAQFSADGRYVVARLKAPYAETRKAKLKKTPADRMPKDSLLVLTLATGQQQRFPNLKSFTLGKEGGTWLAALFEPKPERSAPAARMGAPAKSDSLPVATSPTSTTARAAAKPATKKPKGDDLLLLNLTDGQRRQFRYVSAVAVSDNGQTLLFSRDTVKDSLRSGEVPRPGLFRFDATSQTVTPVDTAANHKLFKQLALDKAGQQFAWLASADSAGADVKVYSLFYQTLTLAPVAKGRKKAATHRMTAPHPMSNITLADTLTAGLPRGWAVNEFTPPRFSDDGQRLYFATSPTPKRVPKDTLTPDDERVKMDVWSWTDARLQPQQAKRLKEEKERGYTTVAQLASGKIVPLASPEVPGVRVESKVNTRYVLGLSDVPYLVQSSWDPGHSDLYLIDQQTGSRQKIANDAQVSQPQLSPGGRYVAWFDERDSLWRAWDVAASKRIDLTRGLPAKFFDEEHDTPSLPGSYGMAGWTEGDRYVWIYDRYDLWQLDPTGREKPLNLTAGWGRQNKVRLRRADLFPDEIAINPAAELWLTGTWEGDKTTGVLKSKNGQIAAAPAVLQRSAHRYGGLAKAKAAPVVTFYRGNFREPNNLFLTDTTFAGAQQLTRINPQQDSVRWGEVELVKWTGTNGLPLEGLLFKPENLDVNKKYPMLTYFYERNSETLNDPRVPAPSRSTINIPYCVSNGYLVFVPDIVYTTGQPGPNAYDCIVPGVLSLLDRPYVDRERLGIQGQSWGGYQTAYIITRTNLFRAAMAGAPVANMTSAYGGIRWETGISRQFQYEKTQSRIGGTLWDKPLNYLENSPLFAANRIQTPLLMMHNDNDGAVPWQQGIEMFTALRRLNKPVWMLVYNGEGHNLTQRHNAKDLGLRMYQFFDYYLKDAPAPAWMRDGRSAVEKDRGEMKY